MLPISVHYIGTQYWSGGQFELYNILEPMGEHPVYSTVSGETIAKHGRVPAIVVITKGVSYVDDLGGFIDRATGKVSAGGTCDE